MEIRPFSAKDVEGCLAILDSCTEAVFAKSERSIFIDFLKNLTSPYFVMEHESILVGCGGYILRPEANEARLVWGMVRADSRRLGLGRFLLLFRLREIGKQGSISTVRVETSRAAAPFFEGQGFRLASTPPNGLTFEPDRVTLLKRLTVCA